MIKPVNRGKQTTHGQYAERMENCQLRINLFNQIVFTQNKIKQFFESGIFKTDNSQFPGEIIG